MTVLITLRPSHTDDLSGVEDVLARAFPRLLKKAYPPSAMVTAVPLLQRADPRQLGSGRHWVAVGPDGGVVGAGGWAEYRRSWSAPRRGALRQFVTDPDHIRRGVGRAIMRRTLESARAARMTELYCQATLNAVPFYAAFGFVARGKRILALAPGIDFVFEQMSLTL